jgi:glycosyltransferase involved in cell wall biosynthesis
VRVLISHPSAELYGSDRMMHLALCALVQQGHSVTATVPSDGPLVTRMRESGADVVIADTPVLRKADLRPRGVLKLLWRTLLGLFRITRIVSSVKPDVVYVNTIVQPWWIVGAKACGRRVVVHVREAEGQLPRTLKAIINAPLMLSDVIVCNSESTRLEITSVLPVSRKPILVIYNGKNWSEYSCPQRNSDTDCVHQSRLSVIGRLSPRKGQDIAIRALAELSSNGSQASLTLVGDAFAGYEWYEQKLRQMAKELGVSDRVIFFGFCDDIRDVLTDTDIAIVPSRIEPFGTVAAESMAAGRLTIVADVQGLAEIVENDVNGLTFPADDAKALAQQCMWALDHPEEAGKLALLGQQDVSERFSLARYQNEVVRVIESVSHRDGLRRLVNEWH